MVDQRGHLMQRQSVECRQRQPVDQLDAVGGKCRPCGAGGVDRGLIRIGQPAVEFHDVHVMPQRAQAIRHAAVIGVAAGDGRERPGNDQANLHGRV